MNRVGPGPASKAVGAARLGDRDLHLPHLDTSWSAVINSCMNYLVYKLTNLVNGKIYIGCHMTNNLDDGYMGSGKQLGYAKRKHGIENFKKEILSSHETPEEMFAEEARLVNEEFIGRKDVYNLTCGGRGSWVGVNLRLTAEQRTKAGKAGGYATRTFEQRSQSGKLGGSASRSRFNEKVTKGEIDQPFKGKHHTEEVKLKISLAAKQYLKGNQNRKGKKHSEETKQKLREIALQRKIAMAS